MKRCVGQRLIFFLSKPKQAFGSGLKFQFEGLSKASIFDRSFAPLKFIFFFCLLSYLLVFLSYLSLRLCPPQLSLCASFQRSSAAKAPFDSKESTGHPPRSLLFLAFPSLTRKEKYMYTYIWKKIERGEGGNFYIINIFIIKNSFLSIYCPPPPFFFYFLSQYIYIFTYIIIWEKKKAPFLVLLSFSIWTPHSFFIYMLPANEMVPLFHSLIYSLYIHMYIYVYIVIYICKHINNDRINYNLWKRGH